MHGIFTRFTHIYHKNQPKVTDLSSVYSLKHIVYLQNNSCTLFSNYALLMIIIMSQKNDYMSEARLIIHNFYPNLKLILHILHTLDSRNIVDTSTAPTFAYCIPRLPKRQINCPRRTTQSCGPRCLGNWLTSRLLERFTSWWFQPL